MAWLAMLCGGRINIIFQVNTCPMQKPAQAFRAALAANEPLKIVGAINAYSAMLAQHAGHKALYLSGAGVANASYGLPDLGMTTMNDVLIDVERITNACDLPLLVDIDIGWGSAFNIARTIQSMGKAGAAAVHMEDQIAAKRCGHRPNKQLVPAAEMCDRLKAALDANQHDIFIIARTDALASEGLEAAIARAQDYVATGAHAIFAEAVTELDQYRAFCQAIDVPVLANITEFGKTPLFGASALAASGVAMALYPLSAFRAMSKAAEQVYNHLAQEQNQEALLPKMQTRKELYARLKYHDFEQALDALSQPGQ